MELWSLFSAYQLMILYICTKFHENISKGFLVFARTRNHDRRTDRLTNRQTDGRTDRWTDGQGDYYRAPPTSSGGALTRESQAHFQIISVSFSARIKISYNNSKTIPVLTMHLYLKSMKELRSRSQLYRKFLFSYTQQGFSGKYQLENQLL